jgi:hypothetical protein
MRNIIKKILSENYKIPHYSKGEILIFPHERHKGMDISGMANELGYEEDEAYDVLGDYFLIKTPVGHEEEAGQDFIDNYPEFISAYERRDLRQEELYDRLDHINNMFGSLQDSVGSTIMDDSWNERIDVIIQELNKLKF